MATNKVVLRSVEEFMQGYQPVYQPIYPLFLGKSQAYSEEVGKIDFKRLEAVGDIRAKHITPKDTEIFQLGAKESSKTFKKYFMANQFIQSSMQDNQGFEDVVSQVLDEHQKQMDEIFLLGEGTSNSTMINNSLFHSNDSNYELESEDSTWDESDPLVDLHNKVMASAAAADLVAGRKVILFYGADVLSALDGIYAAQPVPFKRVLAEVLGANYSLAKIPAAITPNGESGWIVANMDQTKLHYTALPALKAQGVNDEKMYGWSNFLMGSCMLEVLASGGVIRQPVDMSGD